MLFNLFIKLFNEIVILLLCTIYFVDAIIVHGEMPPPPIDRGDDKMGRAQEIWALERANAKALALWPWTRPWPGCRSQAQCDWKRQCQRQCRCRCR